MILSGVGVKGTEEIRRTALAGAGEGGIAPIGEGGSGVVVRIARRTAARITAGFTLPSIAAATAASMA